MNWALDAILKTSLLWTLALLLQFILKRKSAAFRHLLLAVAVLLGATVPFLGFTLPTLRWLPSTPIPAVATTPSDPVLAPAVVQSATPPARPEFDWPALMLVVWTAGVLANLCVLLLGGIRLARIAAAARQFVGSGCLQTAASIAVAYRLPRKPVLLASPNPSLLVTWGFLKPKIVLPAGAEQWSAERVEAVMRHELAHIRRQDWLIHLFSEFVRAIYWFNPLIWSVCRRMRIESECACDDAVLEGGMTPPDYAGQLLELARELNATGRVWSAALAMARPSTIERRFKSMLNSSTNRQPVSAKAILCILVCALGIALPIAMFSSSPVQTAPGGVSGTVLDATGAAVRSAVVILSTAAGQTEITTTTNSAGRYGFANLPAGVHVLQVFAPGFGPSAIANIEVKGGQQLLHDVRMDIGFVAAQEEKPALSRPTAIVQPTAPQPAVTKQATELGQGTIKGVVTDPTGAVVPNVEVSWVGESGSGSRKVVTDETGSFVLSRVPTGPYRVVVALPGFKTLNVDGVLNDVATISPTLAIAPTAEEVTIRSGGGSSSTPPILAETPAQCLALPAAPTPPPARVPNPATAPTRIRQGGFVQQANLIGQVKPIYPAEAKAAGTQGLVVMEVIIGRDGRIAQTKVISGDPVLSSAAIDAVNRWCYTPTKLNGEPVEVVSTVSVNFVLQ
jgi:TonB family protein